MATMFHVAANRRVDDEPVLMTPPRLLEKNPYGSGMKRWTDSRHGGCPRSAGMERVVLREVNDNYNNTAGGEFLPPPVHTSHMGIQLPQRPQPPQTPQQTPQQTQLTRQVPPPPYQMHVQVAVMSPPTGPSLAANTHTPTLAPHSSPSTPPYLSSQHKATKGRGESMSPGMSSSEASAVTPEKRGTTPFSKGYTPGTRSTGSAGGTPLHRLQNAGVLQEPPKGTKAHDDYQHKIMQRNRQLHLGKITPGYRLYLAAVPKHLRDPNNALHVSTPRADWDVSKRCWDNAVRQWRRSLHCYDNVEFTESGVPYNLPYDAVPTVSPGSACSSTPAPPDTAPPAMSGSAPTPPPPIPPPALQVHINDSARHARCLNFGSVDPQRELFASYNSSQECDAPSSQPNRGSYGGEQAAAGRQQSSNSPLTSYATLEDPPPPSQPVKPLHDPLKVTPQQQTLTSPELPPLIPFDDDTASVASEPIGDKDQHCANKDFVESAQGYF